MLRELRLDNYHFHKDLHYGVKQNSPLKKNTEKLLRDSIHPFSSPISKSVCEYMESSCKVEHNL